MYHVVVKWKFLVQKENPGRGRGDPHIGRWYRDVSPFRPLFKPPFSSVDSLFQTLSAPEAPLLFSEKKIIHFKLRSGDLTFEPKNQFRRPQTFDYLCGTCLPNFLLTASPGRKQMGKPVIPYILSLMNVLCAIFKIINTFFFSKKKMRL